MVPGRTTLRALWEDPSLSAVILWTPDQYSGMAVEWVSVHPQFRPVETIEGNVVVIDATITQDVLSAVDDAASSGVGAVTVLANSQIDDHDELIEAARSKNVALAIVTGTLTAALLARRWNTELVRASDARVGAAIDLHEQLVRAMLAGGGINGAMRLALRQVPDFDAVAFTYFGEIVGQRQPSARIVTDAAGLYATAKRLLTDREWAEAGQSDGTTVVAGAVYLGRNPEVFLVFRGSRPITPLDRLAFRQCQVAVLMELGRQQTFRQSRRATVEVLLRGAEDGSLSLSDSRNQLQHVGFEAVEGYRVLCLNVSPDLSVGQVCSLAEDALETSGTPVVGSIDEHVYCIIEESGSDHARRLLDACTGRGWTGINIGVSRVKSDAANLRVAMKESLVAASHQVSTRNGIQRVEELGIHAMLAPLLSSDASTSFVSGLLGPLIERDAVEDSRLLETLTAYFDEGCHPGPAAKRLNIHRHSLANRLDRIESLLGIDPRDPARLLTFSLAVQLWKEMTETNASEPPGLVEGA